MTSTTPADTRRDDRPRPDHRHPRWRATHPGGHDPRPPPCGDHQLIAEQHKPGRDRHERFGSLFVAQDASQITLNLK
jgi:hypothetical protein